MFPFAAAGVYSEDVRGAILVLSGINSGVTHIMFSEDGQTLYTGFRKVWSNFCTPDCNRSLPQLQDKSTVL